MKKSKKKIDNNTIITNKKAFHDYTFEKQLDAGMVLKGWEIKSIRAHKVQLSDSYVIVKHGEVWLLGAIITPLLSASTHQETNPSRTRKLLLHKKEIKNLIGLLQQKGYTLIPQSMYWDKNRVKLRIGLAKGKKLYDKRAHSRDKDWKLQQQRLLKNSRKS